MTGRETGFTMKLKKGSFPDFAKRVEITQKKIVVYGAGVIGQTVAPYWLHEYQLEGQVLCYVDMDRHKQGQVVNVAGKGIPVEPVQVLERNAGNCIVLVTVSAFEPVVNVLENVIGVTDTEVYFLPIMLVDLAHKSKAAGVIKTS